MLFCSQTFKPDAEGGNFGATVSRKFTLQIIAVPKLNLCTNKLKDAIYVKNRNAVPCSGYTGRQQADCLLNIYYMYVTRLHIQGRYINVHNRAFALDLCVYLEIINGIPCIIYTYLCRRC